MVSLQLHEAHGRPLRPVEEARALPDHGLAGDVHARPGGRRSVLLADVRTLAALGLSPGDLREQLTVDLPGLDRLPAGTLIEVGEVVLELTGPCAPCRHIGELLGRDDPEAFRRELLGRRGMLAWVRAATAEGRLRVGDALVVVTGGPSTVGPAGFEPATS